MVLVFWSKPKIRTSKEDVQFLYRSRLSSLKSQPVLTTKPSQQLVYRESGGHFVSQSSSFSLEGEGETVSF